MAAQVDECKTSFLDLPAELRNEIYRLCLVVSRPLKVMHQEQGPTLRICNQFNSASTCQQESWAPGLLRSCKQINHEAASILYGENVFNFGNPKVAEIFLLQAVQSIGQIRDMIVGSGKRMKASFARLLVTLKGAARLRSLTFHYGANGLGMEVYNVQEAAKAIKPLVRFFQKTRWPTDKSKALSIIHWAAYPIYWREIQRRYDKGATDYGARVKAVLEETLK